MHIMPRLRSACNDNTLDDHIHACTLCKDCDVGAMTKHGRLCFWSSMPIKKDGILLWSQWARSSFSSRSIMSCVRIDATVWGENNNGNVVGYPQWFIVLSAVWTCGKPHAHGGGVRHHRTISDRPLPMLPLLYWHNDPSN